MAKGIDTKPLVDYDGVFTREERKRILSRLDSMFNWVGAAIPDEMELEGERVNLRGTIEDLVMKDELDRKDRRRITGLIRALRKREKGMKEMIRKGDISEERAVEIYDDLKGIVRAVSKLRRLYEGEDDDDEPMEKSALMRRVNDERRWKKYLDRVR